MFPMNVNTYDRLYIFYRVSLEAHSISALLLYLLLKQVITHKDADVKNSSRSFFGVYYFTSLKSERILLSGGSLRERLNWCICVCVCLC